MTTLLRDRSVAERKGRAMGTDAHVVVSGRCGEELADHGAHLLLDLERRWSRFDAFSDVSAMNARSGTWVKVSAETIDLVVRAITAWHLTGGRFDPTVLEGLRRLGYDRPFTDLAVAGESAADAGPLAGRDHPLATPGCAEVEVDLDRSAVRLPPGVGFDPGGIGKGLAADRITAELIRAGADGALVNLGGDVRVRGASPTDDAWVVTVVEPAWHRLPITTVALVDGAVTTSTTLRRRWTDGSGDERHHIVDAATGRPSAERSTDAVIATAIAADGWWAEAASTASIGRPAAHLANVETLRVTANGEQERSPGFARFER